MAGTMSPYEAEHLIKGIKDAVGDMPLILHTHCTTGMAYMTVTKAIESGIDVIDCATSCFSNGTSQPATETMFYALQQYGIQTGLNEDVINKVNDFFKPVKQKYVDSGRINPKSMATDAQALVYKVPGGMLSNMIANLTDMKAMDKFDAALAEIPAVRKDLGYPPLVTPLSQMVGNRRYQRPPWRALQAGLQGSQELLQRRIRHRARARLRRAPDQDPRRGRQACRLPH